MELFDQDFTVSDIRIAIFVPLRDAKHKHTDRPSHGFAYSLGCSVTYRFDTGDVLTCAPGQCIYLPKGSNYTVDEQGEELPMGSGTYAINFRTFQYDGPFEPFVVSIRGKEKALSCFEKAEVAWRKKQPGFREECFCSLYRLIQIFRKEMSNYSCLDSILTKLSPALSYIQAHYTSESITLPHLARLCGISEPHLRKLFNAAFSVPPSVYIRNLRLNYAKELLKTGEYSVTTVASRSGFNDPIYFSREFKKATSMTPLQYAQTED
ncbi:MAG: helix-turn-helix transcriptional regulator [Oscillospiraceae bacterium]|nr:helix-turn-helix transcriptional regulator [Oscillospiraceae bacterium]